MTHPVICLFVKLEEFTIIFLNIRLNYYSRLDLMNLSNVQNIQPLISAVIQTQLYKTIFPTHSGLFVSQIPPQCCHTIVIAIALLVSVNKTKRNELLTNLPRQAQSS